jgi:hypothetical protein
MSVLNLPICPLASRLASPHLIRHTHFFDLFSDGKTNVVLSEEIA